MAVEIYIARHGQNVDNVNGVLNGHRDLPLTDLGREQAQELARAIRTADLLFEKIYSSPLSRAFETASIVAGELGLAAPEKMDDLIERDFGIMTGKPTSCIEDVCAPNIIKTDTITYFLDPEDAETFPDLIERGHRVLDELRSRHNTGKILLVCHGDIGKMIYTAATGKNWKEVLVDFHFGNGDLIDIESSGEVHKVKLTQYNL